MADDRIKLNVFGKQILVERIDEEWIAFYQGTDGKRVKAHNVVIPADLDRDGVVTYIADLMHESATETNPDVKVFD